MYSPKLIDCHILKLWIKNVSMPQLFYYFAYSWKQALYWVSLIKITQFQHSFGFFIYLFGNINLVFWFTFLMFRFFLAIEQESYDFSMLYFTASEWAVLRVDFWFKDLIWTIIFLVDFFRICSRNLPRRLIIENSGIQRGWSLASL